LSSLRSADLVFDKARFHADRGADTAICLTAVPAERRTNLYLDPSSIGAHQKTYRTAGLPIRGASQLKPS